MLFLVLVCSVLVMAVVRYETRRSPRYTIPDDMRRADDCGGDSNPVEPSLGWIAFGLSTPS
jgi:hypothetical protein